MLLIAADTERAATLAEAQTAVAKGVTGVPLFVLANKYAISGAQPVAVFREASARAMAG